MKKYKLIIFDLDGTLADTSDGIINCHMHANESMGKPIYDRSVLASVIGGPLLDTYRTKFAYSEEDAREAVRIYRERYKAVGFTEATLYDGMKEALTELKARGYLLAVATLKAERFAIPMLELLGVGGLFDLIHGVDDNDTHTKSSLLNLCMEELGCTREESVLVGDSMHDSTGAKKSGIDFIGATYGFGFKSEEDLATLDPVSIIKKPLDLLSFLK